MHHCDDEVLAAVALGEPVGSPDLRHLETCERCRAEVDALQATLLRLGPAGAVELVEPPARVWSAVEAEATAPVARSAATVTTLSPRGRRGDRSPRRFTGWMVGAAAAAGLVIGGVGVGWATRDQGPEQVLVAQAALADLATDADAGTARVERRSDGTEVLVVDTSYSASDAGSLEVWLIDSDVVGMVSLGFLTGDHAEFEIPTGYDVARFPIVDISVEPADGDPTHSGDSITRGVLES